MLQVTHHGKYLPTIITDRAVGVARCVEGSWAGGTDLRSWELLSLRARARAARASRE